MVSALPTQHPYDEPLGPFYDTTGLVSWLGVSRQAVADRVRRGTLLACRTQDGHLVYPAWQFARDGAVRPGVVDAVGEFVAARGRRVVHRPVADHAQRRLRRPERRRLPRRAPRPPSAVRAGRGRHRRPRRPHLGRMSDVPPAPRRPGRSSPSSHPACRSTASRGHRVGTGRHAVPGPLGRAWGRGGSAATAAGGSTCPPRAAPATSPPAPSRRVRERLGVVLGGATSVPGRAARGRGRLAAAPPARPQRGRPAGVAGRRLRRHPRARDDGAVRPSRRPGRAPSPRSTSRASATRRASRPGRRSPWRCSGLRRRRLAGRRRTAAAADVPGAPLAMPAPRRMDLTVVRPPRTRTRR